MPKQYHFFNKGMRDGLEENTFFMLWDFLESWIFQNEWTAIIFMIFLIIIFEIVLLKFCTFFQKKLKFPEKKHSDTEKNEYKSLQSETLDNWSLTCSSFEERVDLFSETTIISSLISLSSLEENEGYLEDRISLSDEIISVSDSENGHQESCLSESHMPLSNEAISSLSLIHSEIKEYFQSHRECKSEKVQLSSKKSFSVMKINKNKHVKCYSDLNFLRITGSTSENEDLDVAPCPPAHFYLSRDQIKHLEENVRSQISLKSKASLQSKSTSRSQESLIQDHDSVGMSITAPAQDSFLGQNAIENPVQQCVQNEESINSQPTIKVRYITQPQDLMKKPFPSSTQDSFHVQYLDRCRHYVQVPHSVEIQDSVQSPVSGKEHSEEAQYSMWFEDSNENKYLIKGKNAILKNADILVLALCPNAVAEEATQLKNIKPNRQLQSASSKSTHNSVNSSVPLSPTIKGQKNRRKTSESKHKLSRKVPSIKAKKTSHSRVFQITVCHTAKRTKELGSNHSTEMKVFHQIEDTADVALHLICVSKFVPPYMKKYFRKKIVKVMPDLTKHSHFLWKQNKSPDADKIDYIDNTGISGIIENLKEHGTEDEGLRNISPKILLWLKQSFKVNTCQFKTPSYSVMETDWENQEPPEDLIGVAELHTPNSKTVVQHFPKLETPLKEVVRDPMQTFLSSPKMESSRKIKTQGDPKMTVNSHVPLLQRENSLTSASEMQRSFPQRNTQDGKDHLKIVVETSNVNMRISLRTKKHKRNSKLANIKIQTSADDVIFEEKKHSDSDNSSPSEEMECNATYKVKNIHADRSDTFQNAACSTASEPPNLEMYRGKSETGTSGIIKHSQSTIEPEKPPDEDKICNAKHIDKEFIREIFQNLPQRDREELEALKEAVAQLTQEFLHLKQHPKNVKSEIRESCSESRKTPNEEQAIHPLTLSTKDILKPVPWHTMEPFKVEKPEHGTNRHTGREYTAEPNMPLTLPENFSDGELLIETTECGVADDHTEGINENFKRLLPKLQNEVNKETLPQTVACESGHLRFEAYPVKELKTEKEMNQHFPCTTMVSTYSPIMDPSPIKNMEKILTAPADVKYTEGSQTHLPTSETPLTGDPGDPGHYQAETGYHITEKIESSKDLLATSPETLLFSVLSLSHPKRPKKRLAHKKRIVRPNCLLRKAVKPSISQILIIASHRFGHRKYLGSNSKAKMKKIKQVSKLVDGFLNTIYGPLYERLEAEIERCCHACLKQRELADKERSKIVDCFDHSSVLYGRVEKAQDGEEEEENDLPEAVPQHTRQPRSDASQRKELCLAVNHLAHKMPIDEQDTQHQTGFPEIVFEASPTMGFREAEKRQKTNQPENDVQVPVGPKALLPKAGDSTLNKLLDSRTEYDSPPGGNHHRELDSYFMEGNSELPKGWKCTPLQSSFQSSVSESKRQNKALSNIQTAMSCKCKTMKVKKRPISCMYNERYSRRCHFFMKMKNPPQSKLVADAHLDAIHSMAPILPNIKMSSSLKETKEQMREVTTLDHVHVSQGKSPNGSQMWFPEPISMKSISSSIKYGEEEEEQHEALPSPVDNQNFMFSTSQKMDRGLVKSEDELNQLGRNQVQTQSRQTDLYSISSPPVNKLQLEKLEKCIDILPPMSEESKMEDIILSAREYSAPSDGNHQKEQDSVILKKKAVTFDVSSPTLCTSKQMNFKPSSDMKMAVLPKCGILKAEKPLGSHTFSIKGGTSTDPRKQLQCKLATKMNEIQQEEKMMENTCPFIHIKPALKEKLETDTFLNTSCHSMPAPSDVGGNKKLKAEVEMLRQTINLMQIKQEKSNDRKAWDIYSTDWKWSSKDVIKKPLEDNENQKIIPKEIPPSIQGCAPDTYQRKKPDLVKLKNDCPGERSFCNFLVKEQNMQQQTSFPKIVLDSTSYLMNLFQAEKMKEGPQTHKDLQVPHSAEVPPSKLATANLSHETTEGDTELTGTLQKTLGSHIAEDKIELVERLRTPLLKHLDFFTPVSYDPENEIHPTKLSERKITMHPKYLTMKAKKPPFSQSIKIIRQFPTKHRMKMTSTLKNKMREVLSGKNAADGFPETLYFTLDELAIKKKRRFTTQVGTTRVSRFNQPQLPHMDSPPTLIERHLDSIGKGGAENILKEAEVHDGESEQERQEYLMDMGPMCTKTSMINAYLIMEPDPDTSEGATLSESFSPEAQTYTGNSEKPSETDKIKNMKNNLKIGLPDIEKSGIYSELSESMGDAKSSKSDKKRMGNSVLKEYQYDSLAGLILNSIVRHLPALQTIQMHNGSLKIAGMPNASSKGISLKVKQSLNTKGHVVLSTEKKQAHNLKAPKKGEKDKAASSALRKPLCLPVSNSPNMGMEQSPSLGDTDAESSDQSNVLNKAESREKEKHDLEVFLRTASQYAQTVGFRTGQNRECGPFRFEVPFSNRTVPESITPQKTEITLIDQKMKGKCVKETSAMFDISSKICQPHIEKQKMEFENANCQTIAIPKVMVTQTEKPFTGARFLNTMMCGESFQHREEKVEWEDHLALEKRQQKPDISGNIWSSADAHTLMDPKIAKHNNKVKIADGKNIMHSKQVKLKMKRAPASQLRNGEYGIRNGKKELTYTKQGKSCHKSTNVVALVLKAIHESGCITSHVPNLTEVIKREKEKPIFPQLKLEKPCHRRQTLSLESVNTSSNYKNTRQQYIQQLRTSSNQIKRCHHVKVKDLQRKVCFEPTSQKRRSDYTAVDIQGSRRGKEVFVKRQETQQQNPFLQQDMKKLEMVPGTSLGSSPYTMKETLHLNKTVEIRSKQFSIPQMKKESMLTNMLSSSDEEQFLISGVKAQQQKPLTSIMLASMSSYILDQLHTEKPEEETQRKGLFLKGSAQHGKYISNKVCISSVDVVSRSIEKLLLLIKEQEKKRKNIRKGKEFEIAALVKAKMNFSPVLEYSPAGAHFINTKEHVGTFKQRNEEGLDKSVATQRGQDRLWGRGIFLESVYTNEPLSPETVFHEDKRIETVKCTTCPKKAKIKANKTLIFQLLYITGSGTRRNKKELRCNIKRQKTEFRQSENVADFIRKTTDGSECAPSHMREYREVKREKHKKKKLILISPQLKVKNSLNERKMSSSELISKSDILSHIIKTKQHVRKQKEKHQSFLLNILPQHRNQFMIRTLRKRFSPVKLKDLEGEACSNPASHKRESNCTSFDISRTNTKLDVLIKQKVKVNDGDIAKHLFSIPRVRETAEKSGILLNSKEQNLLFTEMDASQHKTVKEQELLKQECISTANLRSVTSSVGRLPLENTEQGNKEEYIYTNRRKVSHPLGNEVSKGTDHLLGSKRQNFLGRNIKLQQKISEVQEGEVNADHIPERILNFVSLPIWEAFHLKRVIKRKGKVNISIPVNVNVDPRGKEELNLINVPLKSNVQKINVSKTLRAKQPDLPRENILQSSSSDKLHRFHFKKLEEEVTTKDISSEVLSPKIQKTPNNLDIPWHQPLCCGRTHLPNRREGYQEESTCKTHLMPGSSSSMDAFESETPQVTQSLAMDSRVCNISNKEEIGLLIAGKEEQPGSIQQTLPKLASNSLMDILHKQTPHGKKISEERICSTDCSTSAEGNGSLNEGHREGQPESKCQTFTKHTSNSPIAILQNQTSKAVNIRDHTLNTKEAGIAQPKNVQKMIPKPASSHSSMDRIQSQMPCIKRISEEIISVMDHILKVEGIGLLLTGKKEQQEKPIYKPFPKPAPHSRIDLLEMTSQNEKEKEVDVISGNVAHSTSQEAVQQRGGRGVCTEKDETGPEPKQYHMSDSDENFLECMSYLKDDPCFLPPAMPREKEARSEESHQSIMAKGLNLFRKDQLHMAYEYGLEHIEPSGAPKQIKEQNTMLPSCSITLKYLNASLTRLTKSPDGAQKMDSITNNYLPKLQVRKEMESCNANQKVPNATHLARTYPRFSFPILPENKRQKDSMENEDNDGIFPKQRTLKSKESVFSHILGTAGFGTPSNTPELQWNVKQKVVAIGDHKEEPDVVTTKVFDPVSSSLHLKLNKKATGGVTSSNVKQEKQHMFQKEKKTRVKAIGLKEILDPKVVIFKEKESPLSSTLNGRDLLLLHLGIRKQESKVPEGTDAPDVIKQTNLYAALPSLSYLHLNSRTGVERGKAESLRACLLPLKLQASSNIRKMPHAESYTDFLSHRIKIEQHLPQENEDRGNIIVKKDIGGPKGITQKTLFKYIFPGEESQWSSKEQKEMVQEDTGDLGVVLNKPCASVLSTPDLKWDTRRKGQEDRQGLRSDYPLTWQEYPRKINEESTDGLLNPIRQAKHIPQEDKRSEIALKEIVQHKEIALTTKKSSVLEELPLNIQEKEEKMQEGNQVRLQKKSYDFIPLPPHSERDTRIEGKEDRERVIRCACPLTLRESSMRRYENSTDDILSQVRKAKFKPQKVKERGEIALKTPIKPKEIALKARKPSVSQTLPLNGEETEKKIQEKKEKQVDIQNKSYAPITLPPHSDLNIRITGEENRAGISQSGYPLTVRESTLKIYEKLADDILSQILKTMLRPQKDKERGEVALYEMAQHQDRALTANKPSVPQKLSLNIEEKEMKMQEKKQVQTLEKSYASIPLPPRCELDTRMKGKAHRQGVVRSGCPRTLQEHTTRIYEESADDLLSQIRKAKFNPQRDNGRGGRALEERAQSKGTALEANPPSVLQKLPLSSEEKEKRVQEDQEEQARIQSKPCSPISLLSPAALDAREKDRIEVRTSGYPLTLREYTMRRYEESADDLLYQIRKAKFKPQKSNGRGEEALKEMVQPKEISWKAKKPSVSQELSLNIEKDTKGQENTEKLVEIQKKSYTSIPLPSPSELNIRIRGGDEDRQAITRSCHPLILQELKRCEELADDILDQSRESKFKPQEDKGRGEIILKEMTESKETALKTKKSSSSQMLLLDIKEKEKMMCEDEDKQVKIPRKSPVSISLPPHAELDRGEEARQEMIRYGYPLTLREYTMRRYENSTGDLLSQIRKTKFKSQERKVRNKITFNTPAPPKEIALKAKKPSVSQTLPLNGEETEKKFQEKKEKQVDIQNKSYAPITLPPHSDLNIRITGEENRAGISQSGYPLTLRESTLKRYEELADDILSQILKTTLRPQKGKERGEVALYEMAQHQDRALTANKPSVPQKLSLNIEEKETKMQEKKQVQTLEKSYASIPLPPRCELDMRMKGDEHRQRVVRSGCPRTLQEHTTRIYEESADDLLSQIRKAKFNPQRDNGRGSIALEERAHPKGTALEANPPSVLQKLPLSSEEKEERVQEDQVEQTEHRPCASIALPPYSELGKRMKEDVLIKTESKSPQQNLRQSLCKTKPAAKKSVCGGNSKMVTNAKASKIPEKGKEKMTEVMLLKQKKLSFSEDVQLSIKEQEEKVQAEKDKSSVVLNSSPTSTAPPSPVKLDARMKTGGSTVEVGRYSLSHQKSPGEVKLVSNGQKAKKYKSQREMDKVQTLATQDNIEPKDRDSKVEQGFSQDLSLKPEEQKTMNPYAKGEEKIALTANCFFKSFLTLHELDKSVHRERYIQGITKSAVVQLQLQKSLGEEQTTHIQSSGGDSSNDVKRVHEYKPQRGEDRGKILSVEYAMYSKGPTSMAKTFPLPRVFRFAGVEPQTRAVPMSRREPMGCVPERKDAQDEVKTVPPPPPHKVDTGVERKNKFKVNKSFLLPPWHMDSLGARKGKYTKLPLNYFERAKHMMHKEMDTVNVTVNKDKMHPKYITWRAKKSPLSQIFNTNKLQMNIKERERSGQEGRSETAVTLSKACAVGTPSTSLTLDTMKEDLSGLRNLVPRIELQESLASQQIASTESMETNTLSNAKQSKKLSQKEGRVTAVAMNRLMHPKERIFKAKMLLYSHVFTITGGGSPGSIFSKRKKTQRNIKRKAGRELERTGEPDVVLRKILTPMLSRPACRLITNIKIDRRCRLSPSPPIYLKQDTRMSQKGSTPGTRPPLKCQAPSDSGKKANAESTDEFMLSNKKGSIQFRTQKVEESSLKIGVQDKMLPRYIWEANKLQVESRKPERKGEEGKNEQVIGVQTIYVSIVTPPHLKFDTAEGEEYVVRITKLPLAEQKSQESSNKTAAYLERVDGKLSSDIKAELMLKEGREKTTDVNGIVDPNNTYLKAKKSSHLRAHNLTDLQWKNKEQKEKAQEGKGGPDTMLTKMRASRSSHSQHIISNRVKEVVCTEPTTGDISNSLKKGGKHMPEEMEEDGLAAVNIIMPSKHQENKVPECNDGLNMALPKPSTSLPSRPHLKLDKDIQVDEEMLGITGSVLQRICNTRGKEHEALTHGEVSKDIRDLKQHMPQEEKKNAVVLRQATHPIDITSQTKKLLPSNILHRTELHLNIRSQGKKEQETQTKPPCETLRELHTVEPSSLTFSASPYPKKTAEIQATEGNRNKEEKHVSLKEARKLKAREMGVKTACKCSKVSPISHMLSIRELVLNLRQSEGNNHKGKDELCVVLTKTFLSRPLAPPLPMDSGVKMDINTPETNGLSATLQNPQESSDSQKLAERKPLSGGGKRCFQKSEHQVPQKETARQCTLNLLISLQQREECPRVKSEGDLPRLVLNSQEEGLYFTGVGSVRSRKTLGWFVTEQNAQPGKYKRETFTTLLSCPTKRPTKTGDTKKGTDLKKNLDHTLMHTKILGPLPKKIAKEMNIPAGTPLCSKGHELSVSEQVILSKPSSEYVGLPKSIMLKQDVPSNKKISNMSSSQVLASPEKAPSEKMHVSELNIPQSTEEEMFLEKQVVRQSEGESKSVPNPTLSLRFSLLIGKQKAVLEIDVGGKTALPPEVLRLQDVRDITEPDGAGREKEPTLTVSELVRCVLESFLKSLAPHLAFLFQCRDMEGESGNDTRTAINMEQKTLEMDINSTLGQEGEAFILDANNTTHQKEGERKFSKDTTVNLEKQKMKMDTNHAGKMHSPPLKAEESQIKTPAVTHVINNCPTKQNHKNTQEWSAKRNLKSPKYPQKTVLDSFYAYIPLTTKFESQKHRLTIKDLARELRPNYLTMKVPNHPVSQFLSIIGHGTPSNRMKLEYNFDKHKQMALGPKDTSGIVIRSLSISMMSSPHNKKAVKSEKNLEREQGVCLSKSKERSPNADRIARRGNTVGEGHQNFRKSPEECQPFIADEQRAKTFFNVKLTNSCEEISKTNLTPQTEIAVQGHDASKMIGEPYSLKPKDCVDARMDSVINRNIPAQGIEKAQHGQHLFDTSRWVSQPCRMDPNGTIWNTAAQKMKQQKALSDTVHKSTCTHMPVPSSFKSNGLKIVTDGTGTERSLPVYEETENILESQGKNIAERNQPTVIQRYVPVTSVNVKITGTVAADQLKKVQHCTLDNLKSPAFPEGPGPIAITHPRLQPKVFADLSTEDKNKLSNHLEVKGLEIKHNLIPEIVTKSLQKINADPQQPISGEDSRWGLYPRYKTMSFVSPEGIDCIELDLKQREPPISCMKTLTVNVSSGDKEIITQLNNIDKVVLGGKSSVIPAGNTTPSCHSQQSRKKDKLLMHFSIKTLEIQMAAFPKIVEESFSMAHVQNKEAHLSKCIHSGAKSLEHRNRILLCFEKTSLHNIDLDLQYEDLCFLLGLTAENMPPKQKALSSHGLSKSIVGTKVDDAVKSCDHAVVRAQSEEQSSFKKQSPHKCLSLIRKCPEPTPRFPSDAHLPSMVLKETSVVSKSKSHATLEEEKEYHVWFQQKNTYKSFDLKTQGNVSLTDIHSLPISENGTVDVQKHVDSATNSEEWSSLQVSESEEYIFLDVCSSLSEGPESTSFDLQEAVPLGTVCPKENVKTDLKQFYKADAGSHDISRRKHTLVVPPPPYKPHKNNEYRSSSKRQSPDWFCHSSLKTTAIQPMSSISFSEEKLSWTAGNKTDDYLAPLTESNIKLHLEKHQEDYLMHSGSREKRKHKSDSLRKHCVHFNSDCSYTHQEKRTRKKKRHDYETESSGWYSQSSCTSSSDHQQKFTDLGSSTKQSKPFFYACMPADSLEVTPKTIRWTVPMKTLRKKNFRIPLVAKMSNSWNIWSLSKKWLESFTGSFS